MGNQLKICIIYSVIMDPLSLWNSFQFILCMFKEKKIIYNHSLNNHVMNGYGWYFVCIYHENIGVNYIT